MSSTGWGALINGLILSATGRGFVPTRPVDTLAVAPLEATVPPLLELIASGKVGLPEQPAAIRHGLADHPALAPDRIRRCLANVPDELVDVRAVEELEPGAPRFGRPRRLAMSATEALRAMERRRLWMNVQKLHRFDEGFRDLVSLVLRSMVARAPELGPEVYGAGAYLIISSGRASCHFHADPDLNFLMQVRGRKRVFTWSPNALDEPTREMLAITGDHGAVRYHPRYDAAASTPVDLEPGMGVFIPLFAPHRVENGDEPCVSLSVGFVPRSAMIRLRVHQVNGALRRLGVPVRGWGQSAALDSLKHPLHLALRLLRRTSIEERAS